jgi:hypothetical protein
MPKSMCSLIPKPKLPVSEKLRFLNSYSLTLRPRSRISSAFGPRTVTWTAIFSLRRIPKVRTVYRALPGWWLVVLFTGSWTSSVRTVDWSLTTQLFEHLCCTGESVTRFAHGDVEDEFLDAQLPHGVAALVALFSRLKVLLATVQSKSIRIGLTMMCDAEGLVGWRVSGD